MVDMLGYNVKEMIGKSAELWYMIIVYDRKVNSMAARAEGFSRNC